MTNCDDLIRRLEKNADLLQNGPYVSLKTAREDFNAAADAQSALRHFADSLADMHGGDHHDDGCPDCAAMIEHAPAIAAARVEGGE
jgi:hypothetical protein